jgi:hypothetical protein
VAAFIAAIISTLEVESKGLFSVSMFDPDTAVDRAGLESRLVAAAPHHLAIQLNRIHDD